MSNFDWLRQECAPEEFPELHKKLQNALLARIDAQRIIIFAVDKHKRQIYSIHPLDDTGAEIRLPIAKNSTPGYAASTGSRIIFPSATSESEEKAKNPDFHLDKELEAKSGATIRQALAYPLMHGKYLMGVILALNKVGGRDFNPEDQDILQETADALALAQYNHQTKNKRYQTKYDWLPHNNVITREEMDKAIKEARMRNWELEEVLIKVSKVSKENVLKSYSVYFNLPYFADSETFTPALSLLDKLHKKNPFSFLEANCWTPFREEEGKIHVLVADPHDEAITSQIQLMVRGEFDTFVGLTEDIISIIRKLEEKKKRTMAKPELMGDISETWTPARIKNIGKPDIELADRAISLIISNAVTQGAIEVRFSVYSNGEKTSYQLAAKGVIREKGTIGSWPEVFASALASRAGLEERYSGGPLEGTVEYNLNKKRMALRFCVLPGKEGPCEVSIRLSGAELDPNNEFPKEWIADKKDAQHDIEIFVTAAEKGYLYLMETCLRYKITNIDAAGVAGYSALANACRFSRPNVMEYLLKQGANPNQGPVSPLMWISFSSFKAGIAAEMVDTLVSHGAEVDFQNQGLTALHVAVNKQNVDAAKALIRHGAAMDVRKQSLF